MNEEFDEAEMWSDQARERYLTRLEGLIEDLRRHGRLVAALDEEHVDHDPDTRALMWTSQDMLQRAMEAVNDAEVEWSGSLSMPWVSVLAEDDAEDADGFVPEDEGLDDPLDGQDGAETDDRVITMVSRSDLRLTDEAAFIAAGRAAYLRRHAEADPDTAAQEVVTAADAAQALYDPPAAALAEPPAGAEAYGAMWAFVLHEQDAQWMDAADPFSLEGYGQG